ncbi:MAG: BsaA family SipW-dependent biofilm matrix protein [Oscillospiraceae bacterium]|jgi:predicted ribosomally synthesized peptide with SipW-like signal peptide|nr:BsaA family SipW-dependent biofilm matrix protein [Oscillospiraceae bacterium]
MKTRKNHKSVVLALAAVMAVVIAVTGSTFAWFTATEGKKNHFETAGITDGTSSIYEVFKEPKEWLPGQEVIKNVGVSNTGENDLLARVSFEEVLDKLSGSMERLPTPAASPQVPVLFNESAYLDSTGAPINGWMTLADALAADAGLSVDSAVETALGAAAYATLLVKKNVTNPGTTSESTGYSFVFWYPIPGDYTVPANDPAKAASYAGKKQAAAADLYIDESVDHSTRVLKVDAASVKFSAFSGRATTKTAWADFVVPQVFDTDGVTPIAAAAPADITATLLSQLDALIHLNYGVDDTGAATVSATPEAGKWVYNPEDGFFYFIGNIEPGTISPLLLNSVTLDETSDQMYTDMMYDLYVNMEAIQPLEAAVRSATGWNLTGTFGQSIVQALIDCGSFDVVE